MFSTCCSRVSRSVRVSRKSWHMLVNLCFHISLTCGVFVGGINQTRYASVCQAVSTRCPHTSNTVLLWMLSTKLKSHHPKMNKCFGCFQQKKKKRMRKLPLVDFTLLIKLVETVKENPQRYSRWFPWLEAMLHHGVLYWDTLLIHFSLHKVPGWKILAEKFLFIYSITPGLKSHLTGWFFNSGWCWHTRYQIT